MATQTYKGITDSSGNTNIYRKSSAVETALILGLTGYGIDFKAWSNTAGDYFQWDASAKSLQFFDSEIEIGQRSFPATDAGVDLTLSYTGLRVCTEMKSTGTGILYNTTDYVGAAGIFQTTINKAVTLALGGGYSWATVWATMEVEKNIDSTGSGSAVWGLLESDEAVTITTSAGPTTDWNAGKFTVWMTSASAVLSGGAKIYGVRIDSSVNASANFTAGYFNALQIDRNGTSKLWQIGINIPVNTCDLVAQVGTLTQNTDGTGASIKDAAHYSGELNPASIIRIFADTDSQVITGDNATLWLRGLIGTTQTGSPTWSNIRSHMYIPTGKDISGGFFNCVRGYWELAGATTIGNATICIAGIEGYFGLTGTVAIGAAAVLAGVKSIIANEGAGAFSGDGKAVAFYVPPGTPHWSHILYAGPNTCHRGIWIGEDNDAVGYGIPLDYTNWGLGTAEGAQGNAIYCDDGGKAWSAGGYIEGMTVRLLSTSAVTGNKDVSMTPFHTDLSLNASYDGIGGLSSIWGNTTIKSGKSIDTSDGLGDVGGANFGLDVVGTLASNSHGCGVSVGLGGSGTKSGIITGFRVRTPTGTVLWSGFASVPDGQGVTQDAAAGSTTDKFLKVYVGTTLYTIALVRA
jgi:hypothetical protein